MSSRYPPTHDSRYASRARSRSPPRYQEWRPPGPSNPGFNNRHTDFGRTNPDPPRAPKTFTDSVRGPGPGTGSTAPLGPRGRGGPPRPEFRELRDAPPLGTDRSFRERDFDRRPRPVSPRPRSPPRNFRDGLPPRDLDLGRPRRDSRDGPVPTGSTYPDQPPFGQPGFGRGGFVGRGRGRGRGDFDFRDRGRRGPIDDRSTFRPRDRSPLPRWGSISRPDREDYRTDRRDDDRWIDRDDRERDGDRFRKDSVPAGRFDLRAGNELPTRTPTPLQNGGPSIPPPPERAPQLDLAKDDVGARRFSTSNVAASSKEPRREPLPPQADLMAGRAEASTAKYGSQASSPPPSGPQVPAFGSFSTKPAVYSGPTSNVWKAPSDVRPPAVPAKATVQPQAAAHASKAVPTAPKAQLTGPPPAAPRAPRALEGSSQQFNEQPAERYPAAPKVWNSHVIQQSIPTAPLALRNEDRNNNQFSQPPGRDVRSLSGSHQTNTQGVPSVPVSPKMSLTPIKGPDMGPSPSGSVQSQTTASENGFKDSRYVRSDFPPPKSRTPPPTAPSGPRRTHSFSTSPTLHSTNIPTAPKAIRGPPVAPRAVGDRGLPTVTRAADRAPAPQSRAPLNAPRAPAWNQWIRPGAPAYREPTIPAKRDASGEEKTTTTIPNGSPGYQASRREAEPSPAKHEDNQDEVFDKVRLVDAVSKEESPLSKSTIVRHDNATTREEPTKGSISPQEASQGPLDSPPGFLDDSSDDDGMELDEEDFAQSKAKFERQKAHLESQLVDLESRQYRAVTPLTLIARLNGITEQDLSDVDPSLSPKQRSVAELEETEQRQEESTITDMNDMDQQDLLTPKQEDVEDFPGASDALDDIMPAPITTIETITLPYLVKSPLTPLSERDSLHETVARQNASKDAVVAHLESKARHDQIAEQDLRDEYLQTYRQWQLEMQSLDQEKDGEERQVSADPGPDPETPFSALENPMFETSRSRLHKFSSEYDIQKVLKESEETARIEQERLDRESKKIQADLEKEAAIPDIFDEATRQRRLFKNNNRYRSVSQLTEIYGYEPPRDTFTEAEHKIFLDIFKDRPKKWGEIAAQLPGRTYADCIHHYYAFKWDGRFRETKGRRKGKSGRGRGGKAAPRTRGSALMADLSRTDEDTSNPPAFTETGRPRRAATRTTYGEKDPEIKGQATLSTVSKKGAPAVAEPSSEKPVKRRKAPATGEKPTKRGRQPLAAAPVAPPAAYEKESSLSKEELARAQILDEASLLTGLQAGRRGQNDPMVMFAHENLSQTPSANEVGDRSRPLGQPSLQRSNPSSYWSVPEQTDFIKFISHFGTDFGGIAAHMGTKTQTMVKNHYLRLIEGGNKQDLVEAALSANARREKGENLGLPPTPTPITKRRYDNPPILQRPMVSQSDFMDIDDPSSGRQPSMPPSHATTSQYPQPSRFMTPGQGTPAPQPRVISNPIQPIGSPASSKLSHPGQPRSNPPPGPKMGFFSEPRLERRPTMASLPPGRSVQQSMQSHPQQQQEPSSQQGRLVQDGTVPSPEFMENLEREKARAMNLQAQAFQDRITQPSPHTNIYNPMGLQRSVQQGSQERRPELEDRPSTPGLPASMISRQGQGMFRNVIGSPAPAASSPHILNPSFRPGSMPSPPKRDDYRPGSVPAPSPAPTIANLAPPPPAEPRKTSNVMSLLNDEPEDPRPAKPRMSDHSGAALYSRAQSPAPLAPTVGPLQTGYASRRDVFNQTPVPRSEYDRPAYAQPVPHVPTPPLQHERLSGGTMTPGGSRQDWVNRPPPTSQPPLSSSPHPPTPLTSEARPYFSHHRTSLLGGLNTHGRHNPSPPPNEHTYLHHSRTGSFSQPLTPAPSQGQTMQQVQQQSQTAQSGPNLQPNPYASGSTSHAQQIQAQQQNQMRHAHNTSVGPGIQRRPMEDDYYREAAFREGQERQERLDRQARQHEAQFQAQQRERDQQSIYGSQYRQTPLSLQQSHQHAYGPPQATGMSLREQSAIEAEARLRDAHIREGQMRRDTYQSEARDYDSMMQQRRRQGDEERLRYEQLRDGGYPGGRLSGGYSDRR